MNREYAVNIIRFILLFLVQGLLLSNVVLLDGKAQIFLYVLFIIMLPFRMSDFLVMLASFLMGLAVDSFYNSPGLHASAAVMLAFVRPYFIRYFTPRDDYEITDTPTISSMGIAWFFKFATVLILVHSLWIFLLEAFSFQSILMTLTKAGLTSLITLIVALAVSYLFAPKKT